MTETPEYLKQLLQTYITYKEALVVAGLGAGVTVFFNSLVSYSTDKHLLGEIKSVRADLLMEQAQMKVEQSQMKVELAEVKADVKSVKADLTTIKEVLMKVLDKK
jgi:predicted nuclease with TOPRIM domain